MAWTRISLPPGFVRRRTRLDTIGRWSDGNLMRFSQGRIMPIGGWAPLEYFDDPDVENLVLDGPARSMLGWRSNASLTTPQQSVVAAGTPETLYVLRGAILFDVTPAGFTPGAADAILTSGGYGAGLYGAGAYGQGAGTDQTLVEAQTWQLDTFGEWLLAVAYSDGVIYIWDDVQEVTPGPAVALTATAGTVPIDNRGVVVTPERFIMAVGADGDDRRVQWSDQEDHLDWDFTDPTNSAGFFTLSTAGGIQAARRGRGETLIWTDSDLWTAQFRGPPFIYGFEQAGSACGSISRQSMAIVDGKAYWMGLGAFFVYDGFVRAIPSDVHDAVFGDMNITQISKIVALKRETFSEVTWFYPSGASIECNRYVTYNYLENHWVTGGLERVGGIDRTAFGFPIMSDASGNIYRHEIAGGLRNDTAGNPIVPFLISGPFEIDVRSGDIMHIQEILFDAWPPTGGVQARVASSFYPTGPETQFGPFPTARPATMQIDTRFARVRFESDPAVTSDFRIGIMSFDSIPAGRRS